MELLLITATRLKIVMSNEDMEKYEITCDNLDYGDGETKRAIRSILDEAKQKVGFDVKGKHVFVQVFPSKDGGCEMYVTQTSTASQNGLPVPLHSHEKRSPAVFRFDSTVSMLEACKHLRMRDDIFASAAYCDRKGKNCYLLMYIAQQDAFGRDPICFSVANEYGCLFKSNYAMAYLREHCNCICEKDAIATLGSLD